MKITERFTTGYGLAVRFPAEAGRPNIVITQKRRVNSTTVSVEGPDDLVKQVEIGFDGLYVFVQPYVGFIEYPAQITWGSGRPHRTYAETIDNSHPLTIRINLAANVNIHLVMKQTLAVE